MAPQSSEVSAGDQALATQYNDLRKDTLDISLGHVHSGVANEGAVVDPLDLGGDWKYISATMIVGNQNTVLVTGERSICYLPGVLTLREIHIRELGELSGSATLNLYVYDGSADMTETLIVDCSLSSQNYRIITGRTDTFQADDWIALFVTGTPTTVKRVAVSLKFERT